MKAWKKGPLRKDGLLARKQETYPAYDGEKEESV